MKKSTCLLVCLVALFLFSACKKNGVTLNADLFALWAKTEFQGVDQYTFNRDGTFEYDVFTTDSVTNAILGYRYKTTGRYTTSNMQLMMYNIQNFSNPNGTYGPITALVAVDGPKTATYTFALNNDKTKLSFYFTCPVNADCTPSPLVYDKKYPLGY
jgi:hypothetical protein